MFWFFKVFRQSYSLYHLTCLGNYFWLYIHSKLAKGVPFRAQSLILKVFELFSWTVSSRNLAYKIVFQLNYPIITFLLYDSLTITPAIWESRLFFFIYSIFAIFFFTSRAWFTFGSLIPGPAQLPHPFCFLGCSGSWAIS